jgi:hypothetical protein
MEAFITDVELTKILSPHSKIYKNLLLDPSNINKIIAGFFSPVNNYLPKSKDFK